MGIHFYVRPYPLLLPTGLLLLLAFSSFPTQSSSQSFTCSQPTTCRSLIDYVSPNSTNLTSIQSLFSLKNLRTLLGANGLPLSTSSNYSVPAKQVIKIPFSCICRNGTGISNKKPVYTVKKDDTLWHIAAEVFAGLVTYQQIAAVSNIANDSLIEPGQKLWIPLPCSCDGENGTSVVHYGHVVAAGSSLEFIAQTYGTSVATLSRLNGNVNDSSLLAGQVLDVPLRACNSSVRSDSLDSPLLVANGTYVFTANNCVKCSCSANDWTLQCESSGLQPSNGSNWSTCPAMQCTDNLLLGNTTTTNNCSTTTCAYAGYLANQTILTTLAEQSTCPESTTPGPSGDASSIGLSSSFFLLMCIHLVLLSLS